MARVARKGCGLLMERTETDRLNSIPAVSISSRFEIEWDPAM